MSDQFDELRGMKQHCKSMGWHDCEDTLEWAIAEIETLQAMLMKVPPCQHCLGNPMFKQCDEWCQAAKELRMVYFGKDE